MTVQFSGTTSQSRDPTVAVSTKLPGQLDHTGYQAPFVWAANWNLTLRGSMLPQNAIRTAF